MSKLIPIFLLTALFAGCTAASTSPTESLPTAKTTYEIPGYLQELSSKLLELEIAYSHFSNLMKQVHSDPSLIETPEQKSEIEKTLYNLNIVSEGLESIQDVPPEYRELDNKVDKIAENVRQIINAYQS